MVLTTIDSAAHIATRTPKGPVHVNCPFREPLANTTKEWPLSCLKGLQVWLSISGPYTKYIKNEDNFCRNIPGQLMEVIKIMQCARRGLLLIGAIHTTDEIWAALLLAKHLHWPVVADILSGLRLRKILKWFPSIDETVHFIDHLDHALLSENVRRWAQPDVVLQIGSRITSKRIAQMLELCYPSSYVMVDKHPLRHDPSHIVTHRIQSTLTEFVHYLLNVQFPQRDSKWNTHLRALNLMVQREISFQISCQLSLNEPHVAQVISEEIPDHAVLFVGNSMVIRDMDMYAHGWVSSTTEMGRNLESSAIPCWGIQVAGNRGASGIDGLLSTAVGFAVGCDKQVFCLIGDISFLHDTNGLAILNQRRRRRPMIIIVVNNHGGAIFSLLPVAEMTEPSVMKKYFYTTHDISVRDLCKAHSVKYLQVKTKLELRYALHLSQQAETDCLIEVESSIEQNSTFHRVLTKSASQAADYTLSILSKIPFSNEASSGTVLCRINEMSYSLYRVQLSAPPTSATHSTDLDEFCKEGFIISLTLEDGIVGWGEVSPIEIHREDLLDVEEQLRYLQHVMRGAPITYHLPLLQGSFSSWIWRSLGIQPSSIFPSVRCGLEMVILNALAARQGSSLSDVLSGFKTCCFPADKMTNWISKVEICALVDSSGSPKEVAHIVGQLVHEGFATIKLKVARRGSPVEDAFVVHEIREVVGNQIKIRVDANRHWTYAEALQFGFLVKDCNLQFIEEPVQSEDDITNFCEETGVPVALDETLDNIEGDLLEKLAKWTHPGIVAIVIKPSVVAGFENAALMAKWARQHDKAAVISAAFETGLGLGTYIQFANYLERQNAALGTMQKRGMVKSVAHGLGTYRWFREDVTRKPLSMFVRPEAGIMCASVEDVASLLRSPQINQDTIQISYHDIQIQVYQVTVDFVDFSCSLEVWDSGLDSQGFTTEKVIVFLHGFLGTGEDWIPIMKALSVATRCISISLPGHGKSKLQGFGNSRTKQEQMLTMELVADILCKAIDNITDKMFTFVGYSMGARLALYVALRCNDKVRGAVIISGSPGLKDEKLRRTRVFQDDAKANYLRTHGLNNFLEMWYAGDLWISLRGHPRFKQIFNSRAQHEDVDGLANALSGLSVGRQPSLWARLNLSKQRLLFIVGDRDQKFKEIAWKMCNSADASVKPDIDQHEKSPKKVIVIPNCGHAVHLENPLILVQYVRKFLTSLDES